LQNDYYFDDKNGSMKNLDKALRLRIEERDGNQKIVLAFKGPRQNGKFKQRQEIEFGIDDAQRAIDLLGALGFIKVLEIQKRRRIWQIGDCEVGLDELPELGTFIEIEGPSEEKIADVQNKLGLANVPHIKESYAALIQQIKDK
jgi:adenylate cyclase class 2